MPRPPRSRQRAAGPPKNSRKPSPRGEKPASLRADPGAQARAEGRLVDLQLSFAAKPGELRDIPRPQGLRRVLIERGDVVKGWDLGPSAANQGNFSALFATKLNAAMARRQWLVEPGTNVYRVVQDQADGLPGLVIDAYAELALVQSYGAAYQAHSAALGEILRRHFASVRVVQRARDGAQIVGQDHWFGPPRRDLVVEEQDLRFRVHFADSLLGTGLFPDQRHQRRRLRQLARGKRVLNLFAYAGGFSVAAAAGGAARVDHVDLSRACQRWGAENFCLNGLSPDPHRFIAEDARDWVQRARRRGERYDIIIVDPPTFARGRRPFRISDDLPALLHDCVDILDAPGLLMVSSNSRGVNFDFAAKQSLDAAQARGRDAQIIASDGQGPDCPWPQPASPLRHLSSAWVMVS